MPFVRPDSRRAAAVVFAAAFAFAATVAALRPAWAGEDSAAAAAAAAGGAAPIDHYYAGGERVSLAFSADFIAATPAPELSAADLAAAVASLSIPAAPVEEWPSTGLGATLVRVNDGVEPARVRRAIVDLRNDPAVGWAGPVYRFEGTLKVFSDVLFAEFSPDAAADAADVLLRFDLDDEGAVETFPGVRRLRIRKGSPLAVLDVVEGVRTSPGVVFAEPLFSWQAGLAAWNDPLWPQQWAHRNSGAGGFKLDGDMDVDDAHDILTGHPSITIAIVDEGVDMAHEDLAANVVAGYDSTDQSSSPPGGIAGNAACGDGHGTSCAGIAAAVGGNGKGIVGVAPDCSIMSVRIGRGSVWTQNQWAATGINLAWQNGADVLSNSWGGGSSSTLITNAINAARTNGRGGLGAVVLFASGNGNASSVSYPSSLSNVISVGATSPCDQRKSPSSCDGESWWGSNYGTGLDVVAPGVLIATTDVSLGCGYGGGPYVTTFNGTSAATPSAAGVAALVLTADLSLTAAAVQDVLQSSADDRVGSPSEDVAGRDNFMGWGRVNAFEAVLAAGGASVPPVIDSVEPPSGPQKGGTLLTMRGSGFLGPITVRIGGVAASAVSRIDAETVTCLTPPRTSLGVFDIEIGAVGGTDTAPGAFEYVTNPVRLSWTGQPEAGGVLALQMEGMANGRFALVVSDVPGSWTVKGYTLDLRKSGASRFAILHRLYEPRLSPVGVGTVDYSVAGDVPVLTNLYFQGIAPDGTGTLVVSNLAAATIF